MDLELLKNLRTGDAFQHKSVEYLALGLSKTPFLIKCLNTINRKIEDLPEDTPVIKKGDWYLAEFHRVESMIQGGELEVL